MRSTPFRSGPARAAAVLAAGALALGLAPASSASAREVSGEQPRRFAEVQDPRGDTTLGEGATPKPPARRRLADLTRVRFRTPSTTGGDLRIVSRWNVLSDGRLPGARSQRFAVYLRTDDPDAAYVMEVGNAGDEVELSRRSRPERSLPPPGRIAIDRTFGRGGRMDLVVSTEWLGGASVVSGFAFGSSGGYYDETDPPGDLDVGPARAPLD